MTDSLYAVSLQYCALLVPCDCLPGLSLARLWRYRFSDMDMVSPILHHAAGSLTDQRSYVVYKIMRDRDISGFGSSFRTRVLGGVLLLLCVCVVAQMLGAPFTLLGMDSDILTESEPISEDMTALSPSPEPDKPRLFDMFDDLHSVHHLPLLLTSVFRPPVL